MWSTWIQQLHEFKLSEWRNFRQNDPRVARYVLTQQSRSAIRTREFRQSFLVLSSPFSSEFTTPKWSEREEDAKYVNSLSCASKKKWKCEMRDRKSSSSSHEHARTTTTVTQSTRSWNAPVDWSLAAHKRRNRIGRRCAWVSAVLLLRVWKERVATSVRRPMARCHIPTLWYDQFSGLLSSVILV